MRPTSFSGFCGPRGPRGPFAFAIATALAAGLGPPALTGVALAQPASAVDMAQARELLNMGLDLRSKGNVSGALDKLRAADALAHTPITGLELGRTYLALGKLVEARETLLSIARLPERSEETARSKAARTESDQLAEQLRSRIPSLMIKMTGVSPESVAVTIDGASIPYEALAAPRLVDPGSHSVSATSTSGGTAQTSVDLKEGEAREVELKFVFSGGTHPQVAPPTADPSKGVGSPGDHVSESTTSQGVGWALVGSGTAVGAAGAVLMLVELSQAKNAVARQDKSSYNSARTVWTAGLIACIAGGAAFAAGGIVLLAPLGKPSERGSSRSVWLGMGPGDLRLGGTW